MHTRAASHDTHTHIHVPHSRPAISDSPAGHVVHGEEKVLEIRIRKLQELALYGDPDVDKPEEVDKDPALPEELAV